MSTRFGSISRLVIKHLIVMVITAILGVGLSIGQLHAESKLVNVPGIGNVGTAETTGNAFSGAKGRSSSSVSLFYMQAYIKIWHVGNVLQAKHNKEWNNSPGGWTNVISSIGYGDYAVTFHKYQYASPNPNTATVYTSQSGAWSCANAWNQQSSPC